MTSLPWDELREAAGDDGVQRVPDGTYDCVVKSAQAGQTSNQNKKISVRFVVESGPYAGSSVFRDFIITPDKPGGLRMFFRFMGVLGIPQTKFTGDYTLEQCALDLVDAKAQLVVGSREWNGQDRADVKDVRPLTGMGFAYGETKIPSVPSPAVPVTPMPSVPSAAVPAPMPAPAAPVAPAPTDAAPVLVPELGSELPPEPPF